MLGLARAVAICAGAVMWDACAIDTAVLLRPRHVLANTPLACNDSLCDTSASRHGHPPVVYAGAEGDVHAGRCPGVSVCCKLQHGVPGEQHARGVPRLLRRGVPAGGVARRGLVAVQRGGDDPHPGVHGAQRRPSQSLGAHLPPRAFQIRFRHILSCVQSRPCQSSQSDFWTAANNVEEIEPETEQAGAGLHAPAGMDAAREPGVRLLRVRERRGLRRPRQLRGGKRPVLLRRRLGGAGLRCGDAELHGGAARMLRGRRH